MMFVLLLLLQVLAAWLAADFASGVAHWAEDTYLLAADEHAIPWPLKQIARDNRNHHDRPRDMLLYDWWDTISTSIPFAIGATLILWCMGLFSHAFLLTFCIGASVSNLTHKYAHMMPYEVPLAARYLQRGRIILRRQDHHPHHTDGFKTHYCPLNGHCNWLLDEMQFWRGVENFISYIQK